MIRGQSRGSGRSIGRWEARAVPRRGVRRRKGALGIEIELRPNFFTRRWNHFPDFRVENQLFLPLQLSPSPSSFSTTLGTTLGEALPKYGMEGCILG